MLDDIPTSDRLDDYVPFARTGERAPAGTYRCAACGYGVTVTATLPRCPMCSGETWETSPLESFRGMSVQ